MLDMDESSCGDILLIMRESKGEGRGLCLAFLLYTF